MLKKLLLFLVAVPFAGFAQFTQNFDGGTTIPTGWSVLNGGDANTWQIVNFSTSTTISAHSGNNAVGIGYGATAHNDFLVTPAIVVTAGVSDFISFWGRSRDPLYPEVISVKISTTTPTAAAFTTVLDANVAPASGTSFYKYHYDLSAYVGQTIYIGFHSTTTDKFYFDIDDVEVTALPNCVPPMGLTSSNIGADNATVSWTSAQANFEVQYGVTGFTLGSGITIPVTNSTTTVINNLSGSTTYQYYVRTDCGEGLYSDWSGPVSFSTLCTSIVNFPFTESFDNSTIPACWTNQTVSGAANWTYVTTNGNNTITPRTGARMAEFRTTTIGNKTKLVTPPIDLTSVVNPQLEFYYANVNWVGDIDQLRVYYKTSDAGAWTQIGTDYTAEQTAWSQVILSLPNPSSTYYIAFEGTSNWARGLNLDDVTIQEALSNPAFSNVGIKLYPNPIKDFLNLEYKSTIQMVEIYNVLGQKVFGEQINANETRLDLSKLNSGNYFVKISLEEGTKTVKVIKE